MLTGSHATWVTMLSALAIVAGCRSAAPAEAADPSVDWSGYPDTEAFAFFRSFHSPSDVQDHASPRLIFVATRSLNAGSAVQSSVYASGDYSVLQIVHDHNAQLLQCGRWNPSRLREVQQVVASLPSSAAKPPFPQLVTVSRLSGDRWRTDVYDARALPPALQTLAEMMVQSSDIR